MIEDTRRSTLLMGLLFGRSRRHSARSATVLPDRALPRTGVAAIAMLTRVAVPYHYDGVNCGMSHEVIPDNEIDPADTRALPFIACADPYVSGLSITATSITKVLGAETITWIVARCIQRRCAFGVSGSFPLNRLSNAIWPSRNCGGLAKTYRRSIAKQAVLRIFTARAERIR